jgi:hypothetical protein
LAVLQAWLSGWNKSDIFSDAAVRHLQSLITDPLCLVVIILGHEPRSLVFRPWKHVEFWIPVPGRGLPKFIKLKISELPSMFVSPVAPDTTYRPALVPDWREIGDRSEIGEGSTMGGAVWVVAGYMFDDPSI